MSLLKESGIDTNFIDSAYAGEPLEVSFKGQLTSQQIDAVSQLTQHDCGVLSATTGFGKTVAAAALIAERKVNTLIIVDKIQLQQQWVSQLKSFLELGNDDVGEVGGGKKKVTGKIDVVTLQSLAHKGEVKSFITQYGQIIVDECHHISAYTFESVLKSVRAKYVYGLTATPIRKDGLHPIIFMQCGPVRYKVDARNQAKVRPFVHRLIVRNTHFKSKSEQIQELYRSLAKDKKRNQQLFDDVLLALEKGRSPIILTERIEHLEELQEMFKGFAKNIITLSGKLSKKERTLELKRLANTPDSEERLVIATGKYIGEGFDDARLDTLFLAMPISWKGTLQQYVGRLHRLHDKKQEVQVYDYVDQQVPMLKRMFEKRQSGYKLMGYVTNGESKNSTEQMQLF
ncbi:DEAD/DEAH box helicase [Sutcliffiella horikoshii]|uniref:DEAD/DEAH box helicase n=1 Tax=Sutcliffiella horikoshii TaxID=79883 RepID=UPI0021CD07AE|nr:DEAD/DEAH box helicase [Sutcliffiella horikoshii]